MCPVCAVNHLTGLYLTSILSQRERRKELVKKTSSGDGKQSRTGRDS
jgi:hypothetical protein